nr:transcription factor TFIIIC subunit tfc4 [Polyrhizophydium stewartii]
MSGGRRPLASASKRRAEDPPDTARTAAAPQATAEPLHSMDLDAVIQSLTETQPGADLGDVSSDWGITSNLGLTLQPDGITPAELGAQRAKGSRLKFGPSYGDMGGPSTDAFDDDDDDDDEQDDVGDQGDHEDEDGDDDEGNHLADDDFVPVEIEKQMNDAIGSVGVQQDYQQVLWEEDQEALREISEHLGPEDGGIFVDLPSEMGRGRKRNKRRPRPQRERRTQVKLPDHLQLVFGEASQAYTSGDFSAAIDHLHEVIRQVPHAQQAWSMLGLIHDELGDKVKSLQANLLAAHLTPKDADRWKTLGQISSDLGDVNQALYCFTKALRAMPDDFECKYDRGMIYRQMGRLELAAYDLQAVQQKYPDDVNIAKELGKIYYELDDIPQAIRVFEGLMDADAFRPLDAVRGGVVDMFDEFGIMAATHEQPGESFATQSFKYRMGLEEINMLCELYLSVADHEKMIKALKLGVGRLDGIPLGTVDFDSDDDFDPNLPNSRALPLDLRVKLGIARLYLKDIEAAQMHFEVLYSEDILEYAELFLDVAEAYMGARLFSAALRVFEMLEGYEDLLTGEVFASMAKCHRQMGSDESAIEYYKKALKKQPDNVDYNRALGYIYEDMGETDLAFKFFHEGKPQRWAGTWLSQICHRLSKQPMEPQRLAQNATSLMLLQDEERRRQKRLAEDKQREKSAEAVRHLENSTTFGVFNELRRKDVLDAAQKAEMLRCARKLMARFQSTKIFFSTRKLKRLRYETLGSDAAALSELNLDGAGAGGDGDGGDAEASDAKVGLDGADGSMVVEGVSISDWLNVFVQYALFMAREDKGDEAHAALAIALDAAVFNQSQTKRMFLRCIMLAIAIYTGNYARVSESCRWIAATMPYANDSYRIYCAMYAGGSAATEAFGTNANQKYFYRQLRQLCGDERQKVPQTNHPVLMTFYGHVLCAARMYGTSIEYYLRAYQLTPKDPIINLALGSAHVHRAMQRKSGSRHHHIVQGFAFLYQYAELRGECPETNYNIARAFHQIGKCLNHFAVPYYEKVLAVRTAKLRPFAAYNLSLIYSSIGSSGLAELTLKEHCTL